MAKGVDAQELLAALPAEARAEFQKQVKSQAGVSLTFTVSKGKRKRKGNWASLKGRVVAVRFSDHEYERLSGLGRKYKVSVGEYVKVCCRLFCYDPDEDEPVVPVVAEKGIDGIVLELVPRELSQELSRRAQSLHVSEIEWLARQGVIRLRGKVKEEPKEPKRRAKRMAARSSSTHRQPLAVGISPV